MACVVETSVTLSYVAYVETSLRTGEGMCALSVHHELRTVGVIKKRCTVYEAHVEGTCLVCSRVRCVYCEAVPRTGSPQEWWQWLLGGKVPGCGEPEVCYSLPLCEARMAQSWCAFVADGCKAP